MASPEPDTAASTAKERIRAAALGLFAERGVEGVSSREILRVAGQRNSNALQYHFGDRVGLLAAVLAPFQAEVDRRRNDMLDRFEAGGDATLRALADALVGPSAAMLDIDGGPHYLRIVAELNDDPGRTLAMWPDAAAGTARWVSIAEQHMDPEVAPLHRRFAAIQLAFSELRRRAAAPAARPDHRLFESNLVDLVTAVLETRPSPETRRLLAERGDGTGTGPV